MLVTFQGDSPNCEITLWVSYQYSTSMRAGILVFIQEPNHYGIVGADANIGGDQSRICDISADNHYIGKCMK